jgi:hypothetical protein
MMKIPCTHRCWKSLIGLIFLVMSLGGYAMAIQDHHGHQYSSPLSEEDVDDVVDDREIEDGEDLIILLNGDCLNAEDFWMHELCAHVNTTSENIYRSNYLISGRSRCILFQKLKWMC